MGIQQIQSLITGLINTNFNNPLLSTSWYPRSRPILFLKNRKLRRKRAKMLMIIGKQLFWGERYLTERTKMSSDDCLELKNYFYRCYTSATCEC